MSVARSSSYPALLRRQSSTRKLQALRRRRTAVEPPGFLRRAVSSIARLVRPPHPASVHSTPSVSALEAAEKVSVDPSNLNGAGPLVVPVKTDATPRPATTHTPLLVKAAPVEDVAEPLSDAASLPTSSKALPSNPGMTEPLSPDAAQPSGASPPVAGSQKRPSSQDSDAHDGSSVKRRKVSIFQPATPQATDALRRKFKCPSLLPKPPVAVVVGSTPDDTADAKLSGSSFGSSEPPSSPVLAPKVKMRPSKFKPLTLRPPPVVSVVQAELTDRLTAIEPVAPRVTPAAIVPTPAGGSSKKPQPFVSPVVGSLMAKTPAADSPALQRRVQLLKQAVQLLKPEGRQQEDRLGESLARWKAAGREVARLLWDHGLSESPVPKADDRLSMASPWADGGFDSHSVDRESSGLSCGPTLDPAHACDTVDVRREADDSRSGREAQAPEEWTMGAMLRTVLRTDPGLFGWSDEDGDWVAD